MGMGVNSTFNVGLPELQQLATLAQSGNAQSVDPASMDLLRQLAQSLFTQGDANGASLFAQSFPINLSTPFEALANLVSGLNQKFASVGDFLKAAGQMNPSARLMDGQAVTLPSMTERGGGVAQIAQSIAEAIGGGFFGKLLGGGAGKGLTDASIDAQALALFGGGLLNRAQLTTQAATDQLQAAFAQLQAGNTVEAQAMVLVCLKDAIRANEFQGEGEGK